MIATLPTAQLALHLALVRNQRKPRLATRQIYLTDRAYLLVRRESDRWLVAVASPSEEELRFSREDMQWVSETHFEDALPIDEMSYQQFRLLFG